MSALLKLFLVVVLSWPQSGGSTENAHLAGCTDSDTIAKALRTISLRNWNEVTTARVKALWPNELIGIDCDRSTCTSIGSRGRIINGRHECSETFLFKVDKTASGAPLESLNNLVIHYATSKKQATQAAARKFASAMGLPDADLMKIAGDGDQQFTWATPDGKELVGLSITLTGRGKRWAAALNLSHYPK